MARVYAEHTLAQAPGLAAAVAAGSDDLQSASAALG
jgi:hypothetical protein